MDEPTDKIPAYQEAGDTTQEVPKKRPRLKLRRWVIRFFAISVLLAAGIMIGGAVAFTAIAKDLPKLSSLGDYKPKQSSVVYGKSGEVVARFAEERRTLVPLARVPKVMTDAVVAAEDAEFFTHGGLDYVGIVRCAITNTIKGAKVCGGSTITQQMVKTFLLTPEKTLSRKLREMILAKRVEDSLSKQEILYLYLNQIYFGHSAYGIQEASRVYFGKDVERLTVAEAALLAGLPKSPTRIDPYKYPDRAVGRRGYVLGQMKKLGMIDEETWKAAKESPIQLDWQNAERDLDNSNHYAAQVRRELETIVGKDKVDQGGYEVHVGMDPVQQRAAEEAVREGVRELDKRQGWRGPLMHLEPHEMNQLRTLLGARLSSSAKSIAELPLPSGTFQPVIWDLSELSDRREGRRIDFDELMDGARFRRFELNRVFAGLVTAVDDSGKAAAVDLGGGVVVQLPIKTGLSWARTFSIHKLTPAPKVPSEVLHVGDVVLVKATMAKAKGESAAVSGVLEQSPIVQAALVSIDPQTRQVRALVGGYGLGAGTFNRATQARRQPGSTFKPFVYSAALESGKFTTIATCKDAPRVYRDPWTGVAWKPENYDNHFDGEITLRTALTKSKNLCSVQLIDTVGVDKVIDFARRAGIESPLPRNLTLGLGSGDVTPLEITNAYATLATQGAAAPPIFIRKVVAPSGDVVFESKLEPKQTLPAEVTYQITSLMQSVVEDGTAMRVKVLNRPIAGKTGTTNESRNAWFIGFTPDIVTGVWVGFDNNDPLGPGETGGRAAIPIWLQFSEVAMKDTPIHDFIAPPGIVFALVDPKTGRLAPPDFPGAKQEPFIPGTEPTDILTSAKSPTNFGRDDMENEQR